MRKVNNKKGEKYFVSIAMKVPVNFETTISANSEKEAFEKAMGIYDSGKYDNNNISDPDWTDCNINIDKCVKNYKSPGVFIELEKDRLL